MKNAPHILIVDDDTRILKLLKKYLVKESFLVSTSSSTKDALVMLTNFEFDIMILDVMMPETTGLEFASQIKLSGNKIPIVMLTALSEPEDRVKGLESGANDYMTKPFDPRELVIRINNLIKSKNDASSENDIIIFGINSYNKKNKELLQNEERIQLSSSEENLLEALLNEANNPISREDLSDKLGGVNIRSIDVQIVRLRNKIESDPKSPQYLKTVRNKGYAIYI